MNQHLSDDDWLFGVLNNNKRNTQMKTLFSRYDEYFLYLGMNRNETRPYNYLDYVKVYLRADTKKTEIRRTYQKIMEFYANATSLLIGIYRLLNFIFKYIDSFYAENWLTRRLFFLKEFKDLHNFDIYKKSKKIKELISLTDNISFDNSGINSFDSNLKGFDLEKIINNCELKTFSNHNKKSIDYNISRNSFPSINEHYNDKSKKTWKSIIQNENEESKELSEKSIIKNNKKLDLKKHVENDIEENQKYNNMNYYFNIFEIIISFFCKCLLTKKLTLKSNIYNKAQNYIYSKLDIISYIRNMFFIDLINENLIDENKKDIINFLCRPILSFNKREEFKLPEIYQNFNDFDFDKFYEEINELNQKQNKEENEKKLILLINKRLKNFI